MGKSPAYTESRSMSRSPITKLGTHTPVMVTAAKAASLSAFRRAAATTPAGMAMSTDTNVADSASWSDTGTRSNRSRATGSREKSDRPMSPCRSRPNHRAYCSCTGRSNPRLDRISCTCSADASVRDQEYGITGHEPYQHEHDARHHPPDRQHRHHPPHHPPHASPRSALAGDDHDRTTETGRGPEAGAAGAFPRPVSSGEFPPSGESASRGQSECCSGCRLSVL